MPSPFDLITEAAQPLTNTPLLSAPTRTQGERTKLELSTPPRLYVTFKVFQLVTSLRKRIKTRAPAPASKRRESSSQTTDRFCLEFERQASEKIDYYLGRKTSRPNISRCWDKFAKQESPRPSQTVSGPTIVSSADVQDDVLCKRLDWLLETIQQSVKSEEQALAVVAASDTFFLHRRPEFNVRRLSTEALINLLVAVEELLDTLRRFRCLRYAVKTSSEGDELFDPRLDETFLANLEHLLLCLKQQLLQSLVAKFVKLVRQYVIEWQREEHKRGENWFFEFPDARHPLSTTWPWSIRPSLAVLWGVCWMFYDYQDFQGFRFPQVFQFTVNDQMDFIDEQAETMQAQGQVGQYVQNVPQQRQQPHQQLQGRRRSRQYQGYLVGNGTDTEALAASGIYGTATATADQMGNAVMANYATSPQTARSPRGEYGEYALGEGQHNNTAPQATNMGHPSLSPVAAHDHPLAHAFPGYSGTNSVYSTTAAPSAYVLTSAENADNIDNWQPQVDFSAAQAFQNSSDFDTAQAQSANGWQRPHHQQYPAVPEHQQQLSTRHPQSTAYVYEHNSRLPQRPRVPAITLDTELPSEYQDPNPYNESSSAHSSNASGHPRNQSLGPFYAPNNYRDHLSPQDRPFMNPDQKEMQTPPRSPHADNQNVSIAEQINMLTQPTRKRSHSDMSGGEPAQSAHGSRAGSVHSIQLGNSPAVDAAEEAYSPRNRIHKRGDAPKNEDHKYICTWGEECQGLTFERKCEWSKHMDKHDRPYHCDQPQCAKLQGFTYSGGLLRHEREVHGKHGGPKSQLMCPHADCKRATGKGFTRKENLNEHIRRVHSDKHPEHPQFQASGLKHDSGIEALASAAEEELGMPVARVAEAAMMVNSHNDNDDNIEPALKRRRYDDDTTVSVRNGSVEIEDLKGQIARLEAENIVKDERLQRMEQAEVTKELKYRELMEEKLHLEQTLQLLQQPQQQQQIVPTPQMQTAG